MMYLRIFLAVVISAMVSGLAFSTFMYSRAYVSVRSKFADVERQYQAERDALDQRSSLWHGTLVAIDTEKREIVVALSDQVFAGRESVQLVIQVDEQTLFVRQSLVMEEGVYVGFGESAAGSLSDLLPGMRIGITYARDPNTKRVVADVVTYGAL